MLGIVFVQFSQLYFNFLIFGCFKKPIFAPPVLAETEECVLQLQMVFSANVRKNFEETCANFLFQDLFQVR